MRPQILTAILAFTAGVIAVPAGDATIKTRATATVAAPLSKRTTHDGEGTVFEQEGGTGSCGQTNPDRALIVAISDFWMLGESPGPFCGRMIQVTNVGSDDGVGGEGNTIITTVEDTCASCDENHLDFSVGSWDQLTNSAAFGTVNIEWHFCNADGQC